MKDKMRGFLGFLGLIEDDYGDYGTQVPVRPFSDQADNVAEPEWVAPVTPRQNTPSPQRPNGANRQPTPPSSRTPSISVLDASGQSTLVRPMASPGVQRAMSQQSHDRDVAIFVPRSYDESRRVADLLRANRAVVMNVVDLEPSVARRLVDFAAGTCYALGAKIEVLGNGIYLVSPKDVIISPDAKDRLRATNYRELGDAWS